MYVRMNEWRELSPEASGVAEEPEARVLFGAPSIIAKRKSGGITAGKFL